MTFKLQLHYYNIDEFIGWINKINSKYNDYHSSTVVLLLYVFYLKFKVLTKENTEMFGACLLVYT